MPETNIDDLGPPRKGRAKTKAPLPYHRRNHRDFLHGCKTLSDELYGFYSRLCDLIYDNGGPIEDDEVWLAGVSRCSTRKYRAKRDALIAAGKIEIVDGFIVNRRCETELAYLREQSERQANRGQGAPKKRRQTEPKTTRNQVENDLSLSRTCAELDPNSERTEVEKTALSAKNNDLLKSAVQPQTSSSSSIEEEAYTYDDDVPSSSSMVMTTKAPQVVWDQRLIQAKAIMGGVLNLTQPATHHIKPLRDLCEPGKGEPCDWDRDIVPALERIAGYYRDRGELIRSFAIARNQALENRNRRLTGNPEVTHVQARSDHARKPASAVAAAMRVADHFCAAGLGDGGQDGYDSEPEFSAPDRLQIACAS